MAEGDVPVTEPAHAFGVGDRVQVRKAYPIGHCRTPWYLRGACGQVERICGVFYNPEELAYGRSGAPELPLYRVRVALEALWGDYDGSELDVVEVEVYEHWLSRVPDGVKE